MEYRLFKQTVTTDIYNVNNIFYLIVPKIIIDKNIKVIIDSNINSRINEISNTSSITIARPFALDYFNDIGDISSKQRLKAIINQDLSEAKEALTRENIEFSEEVTLSTPFEEFKEWYLGNTASQKKIEEISINQANPEESYKKEDDNINATLRLKKDLLALREELIEKSEVEAGSEKGHRKVLSNGKSTLKSFDDGFVNIIFLSLVTIIVTVGTMMAMIYVMR